MPSSRIRGGPDRVSADLCGAVFLVTTRILRRLRVLELSRPEPDDGMKLAFRAALGFPIIAYLPFLLHLVK